MSLAIDLTQCQQRLAEAEKKASAEARRLKAVAPPQIYNELMLQLCTVTAEVNKFKTILGAMRMMGELDQRPPEVTAERMELGSGLPLDPLLHVLPTPAAVREFSQGRVVPMVPAHALRDQRAAFALELQHIGDDTLKEVIP